MISHLRPQYRLPQSLFALTIPVLGMKYVSLKGGVMTLNNKDVLFGKANGEFTW